MWERLSFLVKLIGPARLAKVKGSELPWQTTRELLNTPWIIATICSLKQLKALKSSSKTITVLILFGMTLTSQNLHKINRCLCYKCWMSAIWSACRPAFVSSMINELTAHGLSAKAQNKKKTTTKSNYGCRNFLFLERTSYDKFKDFLSLLCTKNITFTSNRTCTITRTDVKQNPFPRANAKISDQCFTKCKAKTTHQQSFIVLVQQATLSAAGLGFWANKKEN